MTEKTIWSNYYDAVESYEREIRTEHPEMLEEEVRFRTEEMMLDVLEDERLNLNIPLQNGVIIIAELGFWDGTRNAYREIAAQTIGDCLCVHEDFCRWYIDENEDLRCNATHYDGTNHYLYREWRSNLSHRAKETFRKKIVQGDVTEREIKAYTRKIGDKICNVCGW